MVSPFRRGLARLASALCLVLLFLGFAPSFSLSEEAQVVTNGSALLFQEHVDHLDADQENEILKVLQGTERFAEWLEAEASELPWGGRIDKIRLCEKAREAIPTEAREVLNPSFAIEQQETWKKEGKRILIDEVISPYFMAFIVNEACSTGKFTVFDPIDRRLDDGAGRFVGYSDAGHCPEGPVLTLPAKRARLFIEAANAFENLEALQFICIGSWHGNPGHPPWAGPLTPFRVSAKSVRFANSRFLWPFFQRGTVESFIIEGTIPAPEGEYISALPTGSQIFPGTIAEQFGLVQMEIGRLIVRSVAIGNLVIGNSTIREPLNITRSRFGVLHITGAKLKRLNIWQVEVRGGSEGDFFQNKAGGFHLNDTDIAEAAEIGTAGDAIPSMISSAEQTPSLLDQVEESVISTAGPRPPWIEPTRSHQGGLSVRGYMTLAQSRIGGDLVINGLILSDGEADNYAMLNMNAVRAKRLTVTHSDIALKRGHSLHGTDMSIEGDISILYTVVRRLEDGDEPSNLRYVRFSEPWTEQLIPGSKAAPVVGFKGLIARDIILEQSVINDTIALVNANVRHVVVTTAPPETDAPQLRDFSYCLATVTPKSGDLIRSTRLQGGLRAGLTRALPVSESLFPTCYGTIIMRVGTASTISAQALLSDLIVDANVTTAIWLAGRISGMVHLGNARMKDGLLQIGSANAPLIWCNSSEMILDGAKIGTIQADREVFRRSDCTVGSPIPNSSPSSGLLRMSMRGANVDRIMGAVQINQPQAVDAGLLGLDSRELVQITAAAPELPPLLDRLLGTQMRRAADSRLATLDPATLAQFAKLLKENGYTAKATDLTIERISRQKWDSSDTLDRLKWLLGWPIGWGYQVEWGFLYALGFIFMGAWVSAYYRSRPRYSPPPAKPWPQRPRSGANTISQRARQGFPLRINLFGRKRDGSARFELRIGRGPLARIAAVFCIMAVGVWVPNAFWLAPAEAAAMSGTLFFLAVLIVVLLKVSPILRGPQWHRRLWRLRAAAFWAQRRNILSFHTLFFSLDRFLPAPGLHAHWANYPRIGQAGRNYFYVHRLAGLILVSITAAGFIGLFD